MCWKIFLFLQILLIKLLYAYPECANTEYKFIKNFIPSNMQTGFWYKYGTAYKTSTEAPTKIVCKAHNIKLGHNEKTIVVRESKIINGKREEFDGRYRLPKITFADPTVGLFEVKNDFEKYTKIILDTDYSSYALLNTCSDKNGNVDSSIDIYTFERDPLSETVEQIEEVLETQKLPRHITKFCPTDNE